MTQSITQEKPYKECNSARHHECDLEEERSDPGPAQTGEDQVRSHLIDLTDRDVLSMGVQVEGDRLVSTLLINKVIPPPSTTCL
jgi:hypothetical protein